MALSANRYRFECGGIALEYLDGDVTGQPNVHLRIDGQDISARGDEVDVASTPVGTLVTVGLPFATVPDLKTESFSALLPDATIGEGPTPVWAIGIRTTESTAIAPDLVQGAVQSYQVMLLNGEASLVETLAG
jgi:hypothetical protein